MGDLGQCRVGLVSWTTVRVPPLLVKREMCVEVLINEGHTVFFGGGEGRMVMNGYCITTIFPAYS